MREPKPFWNKQKQCWYVQFGKRQIRLSRDEKEAWERYHKLMTKERPASGITARELIDRYWEWAEMNLAPSTLDRRKPRLRSLKSALRANLRAEDTKVNDIQGWVSTCFPTASQTTKSDLIGLAKSVFNWGLDQGYLNSNPIVRMKRPASTVRQTFVPVDLWPRFLELATDQQFKDFLEFMFLAGVRVQEIRLIEGKHVIDGACYVPTKPKRGKPQVRPVWLPEKAKEIAERLSKTWKEGPIFRNKKGQPWTRNAIRCRFRRLKVAFNMPDLCATTLRHSYTHYRMTQGQDSAVVAKLMGHADTRMIMERYGHLAANREFMLKEANRFAPPLNGSQTVPDQPA